MEPRRRVLVADTPSAASMIESLVNPDALVVAAQTMEEAEHRLAPDLHLIVCGTTFAESRMFDLLREAKRRADTRSIPFVCLRSDEGALRGALAESLKIASEALGASLYLDLVEERERHGVSRAHQLLREALLSQART